MSEWKTEYSPARGTLIVIGGKYYPVCDIVKVSELPDIHNAEVAALQATIRDLENEHSDRLKAVLEYLRENAAAQCECEHNRDGERMFHCEFCQDYENAVRIAEGEA